MYLELRSRTFSYLMQLFKALDHWTKSVDRQSEINAVILNEIYESFFQLPQGRR